MANSWNDFLSRMQNTLGTTDQATKDALNTLPSSQQILFQKSLDEIDTSRQQLADAANQAQMAWNNGLQSMRYNQAQQSGISNVAGGLQGLMSANSLNNSTFSNIRQLSSLSQNESSLDQRELQIYADAIKSVGGTSSGTGAS